MRVIKVEAKGPNRPRWVTLQMPGGRIVDCLGSIEATVPSERLAEDAKLDILFSGA